MMSGRMKGSCSSKAAVHVSNRWMSFFQVSGRALVSSTIIKHSATNTKEQVEHMRRQMMQCQDPADAWETLWQEGVTPWDLGGPTKALLSEVNLRHLFPKRTLIPGCGSGHDLIALARYLDENTTTCDQDGKKTIVGLEISSTSLQRAQQVLEKSWERHGPTTQTQIHLYEGDFFELPSTWNKVCSFDGEEEARNEDGTLRSSLEDTNTFDFIFDYLFFCAIPPNLRNLWGQQMSRLLTDDNGELLTLMFPYSTTSRRRNDAPIKGPPYLVCLEDYRNALEGTGLKLQTPLPYASLDTVSARKGQEVVGWWSFGNKPNLLTSQ